MRLTEPASAATADRTGLREALLARVRTVALGQDAGLDTEPTDTYELAPPGFEELAGLAPDLDSDPPDGADAWLADLPEPLLAEYLAATARPAGPEPIPAGRLPREFGDGCGFAAGGVADSLPPGVVLAGLAGDAWAAGLGRLTDDELIGVLRAARRLASWSAAMELAAVADPAARRGADVTGASNTGASNNEAGTAAKAAGG
ncbi:MAG TPA: hypothetical protein VG123_06220, partial [Streptosporangiaceae bacterium]|nr:hypothetical protein [Streptosporangiaceae bacterium]